MSGEAPRPAGAAAGEDGVVARARFDPKLRLYLFLQGALVLLATVVGIPLLPVWLLGWGQWWSRRHFESLVCTVGEETLEFGKGRFFRVEKTIPLDTIQDLTLKEGPLLRAVGLCSLDVQTAGQSSGPTASEAELTGLVEPRRFRAAVLAQRARRLARGGSGPAPAAPTDRLLAEIRDTLGRIESRLDKPGSGR